jgi:hypothetical protein
LQKKHSRLIWLTNFILWASLSFMKKILFIFGAFLFTLNLLAAPNAPQRVNGLLRFIAHNQALRDYALYTLIANRCNTYMNYFETAPCREAVKRKIEILDFDIILSEDKKPVLLEQDSWKTKSFVFVAFKKDLIKLLSERRTTIFLEDLQKRLTKYLTREDTTLNIWNLALAHYRTSYEAARAMAVLFQDTSLMKLHLAYLTKAEIRGSLLFNSNKALLARVLDTVNLVLDYSEETYQEIFYPTYLKNYLNRNIYHFYVPLYLAKALHRAGVQHKYAFIAPFLMTLTYEFITSANDYRYLFKDPERIDPGQLGKLKDIYGGYCGSNFGVYGISFYRDFEILKESFARSTHDTLRFLLNQ